MVLCLPASCTGAEVVESGLADRPHLVVLGQAVDLAQRVVERSPLSQSRGLVRVQRDGGHDGRLHPGGFECPVRALDVAPHLDDPGDAHRRGAVERVVDVDEQPALGAMVEVAVVVDHR